MTNALFKKKSIWNILCLFCGLFLIGLFVFLGYVDSEATWGDLIAGVILGVAICIVSILSCFHNLNAYLSIDDNGYIQGKFNYFEKIDCHISNVDFVLAQNTILIIQLKTGKIYTIRNVMNSGELSYVIRRNMSFEATEQAEILIEKLPGLASSYKRSIAYFIIGVAMMFINIFITAFLTGMREMYEFSAIDWVVMAVMGVVEIGTIVFAFYFGLRMGKYKIPSEKLDYDIKRTVILSKPLPPGNVISVFVDVNYLCRIVILGFPNENSVYYMVQKLDLNYDLIDTYTSGVYDGADCFSEEFNTFIDITKKFT